MIVGGVVESFDEHLGSGLLRSDDGESLYFHCVALADGTRVVSPGTRLTGQRAVGRLGVDEARDLRETPS